MNRKNLIAAAVIAVTGIFGSTAWAQAKQDAKPFQKSADPGMMAQMQSLYPNTQFKEVSTTVIPGVFEVVMGKNTAYVDSTGRYFLFGRLFDMQTQNDLSPAKPEPVVEKIDLGKLKTEDAIKTVKGSGARTLYVFSDPDCPFCTQLEKNLANVTDVTIYTFLFPLEGLHPDAKRKAVAIWCSKDRAQSWEQFMSRGALPPDAQCDNPVERNIALGQQFGINGTPTLIAGDGRMLPGAASADRINAWLGAK